MTPNEIAAQRLAAQRIAPRSPGAPSDVVAWLGAVQAQDYAASKWALGARVADTKGGSAGASDATIEAALSSGAILRTHALRFTWQLVTPADIRWILALVAPRLQARAARRNKELELDAATFRKSRAALEKALRGGCHLTRGELATVLEGAGIATAGQRLSHLLAHAELDALICSGARAGKQVTYALLDDRAPSAGAPLARDEALAELAGRYFRSRGPATIADFTWWSGLTSADARAGLDAIASTVVSDMLDGQTYWRSREAARAPATKGTPNASLLPAFDEYLVGYRVRDAVLDPRHVKRLNAGGGLLAPCAVLDGRVVGTWRRTLARTTVVIEIDLFDSPTTRAKQALSSAGRRYAAFLGLEASISIKA